MPLRPAYFVPHSKKANELFQEMRKDRAYIAVVIDEFGGTMGIVTMEDLVEKIVGSIQDEYDDDELPDIATLGENTYRAQGMTALEVAQDYFGTPLPVDEYDTLSGFIIGRLGYIPSEGETPEIAFGDLLFTAERVEGKRIVSVLVKKNANLQ